MKSTAAPLLPGLHYHIYNRGNNRENIFFEERNYLYFLSLYTKYIVPITDTFAYCLMKNHFHLCVRIKTEEEFAQKTSHLSQTSQVFKTCEVSTAAYNPSRNFSNFFNAYAKAINKAYQRSGSLFEERFGRIPVMTSSYIITLIYYIHSNPQKHGFVDNFQDWKWSSYVALTSNTPTQLNRTEALDIFGGLKGFKEFHSDPPDELKLASLIDPEFDLATSI